MKLGLRKRRRGAREVVATRVKWSRRGDEWEGRVDGAKVYMIEHSLFDWKLWKQDANGWHRLGRSEYDSPGEARREAERFEYAHPSMLTNPVEPKTWSKRKRRGACEQDAGQALAHARKKLWPTIHVGERIAYVLAFTTQEFVVGRITMFDTDNEGEHRIYIELPGGLMGHTYETDVGEREWKETIKKLPARLNENLTVAPTSTNPIPMGWGAATLWGLGAVAAGGAIGAPIGAAVNESCDDCHASHKHEWVGLSCLFCGPKYGAAMGVIGGATVASAIGGVTALVSEKYRRPGIVALIPGALMWGAIGISVATKRAAKQKATTAAAAVASITGRASDQYKQQLPGLV